ncbi:MAG: hypothetical protein M1820_003010 [Bogoriella megaspora]|nr:MAG: hypothetical protein M1820_003010 [Bogoriella megaspora]
MTRNPPPTSLPHIFPSMQPPPQTPNHSIEDDSTTFAIHADILIPGSGDPQNNITVVIKDSEIHSISPTSTFNNTALSSIIPSTSVPILMPGLWDCHVHYFGIQKMTIDDMVMTLQSLAGARSVTDVARTLNAGFTSVREVGGYGAELSKAINEGTIPGPNIYPAVAPISMTAGHADAHGTPEQVVHDMCDHGVPLRVADGVSECRKAVRQNIRRGAKVIKVMGTGGVLSSIDDPHAPEYSMEELEAMVEEAERAGLIVAAHCHGKEGIMQCLKAGIKTIEHGTYGDDEVFELMKEKGAMLVATRTIVINGVKHPELMSPESYEKMKETARYHAKAYALAVEKGVNIALGTDLGVSMRGNDLSHGKDGQELKHAVDAGMTPLQAIEAATAKGPLTLGPKKAPKSGQIKEGYDADLIALSENPLKDIEVLSDAANVKYVWKGGKLFKKPGLKVSLEL